MVRKLFMFMWRNAPPAMRVPVLALAVVTGLARDAMLFVTLTAANDADKPSFYTFWLPLFVVALITTSVLHLVYPVLAQTLNSRMALSLRCRLVSNLLRVTPMFIETRKHGRLYHVITSDVGSTSFITLRMFESIPSLVFLCVAAPQLFWMSPVVGGFAVLVMIGGCLGYYFQQRSIADVASAIREREIAFFERVSDVISGFRELKLNQPRRHEFETEVKQTATEMSDLLIGKERRYAAGESVVQGLKYLLLGGVVFITPMMGYGESKSIFSILTVILFALGPFETLVSQYPDFLSAGLALERIEELDGTLRRFANEESSLRHTAAPFASLKMEAVTAVYEDQGKDGFVVGPIDFELHRGETVFIIGNNGSGKTTFLNVLAGLFTVASGRVLLNGAEVQTGELAAYRGLFSAVFSTFHLFYRLFGFSDLDPDRARGVLDRLMLADVTDYGNGRFTRQNLSSGQRRRLALAVVLLEDRDVLILDEFVADQDPSKREFFFKTLLPELKALGKTVVVSTHDLSWATCCDRIVRFANGRIVEQRDLRQEQKPVSVPAELG